MSAGGRVQQDQALSATLIEFDTDLVLLAGYMQRLGPATLAAFGGRIINTHPALLPEFGGQGMFGSHVHRAVLAAGRRISGATVHWVDENYDTGAVIAQTRVPVETDDSAQSLAAGYRRPSANSSLMCWRRRPQAGSNRHSIRSGALLLDRALGGLFLLRTDPWDGSCRRNLIDLATLGPRISLTHARILRKTT